MAKSGDFSPQERLKILAEADRVGNVSQVCRKHGISRHTLYYWRDRQEEYEKSAVKTAVSLAHLQDVSEGAFEGLDDYVDRLKLLGDIESRKKLMAGKLEGLMIRVMHYLDSHEDLALTHPKDMAKLLKDINDIRKQLSNEPDVVIEHRNKMMETVLSVLQKYLDRDQIQSFVAEVEALEDAQYEEI